MFGMDCCSGRDPDEKLSRYTPVGPHGHPGNDAYPQPAAQGKPVGVGIVFQPDSTGALHVKSLAVGGSAEQTGQIQVGDVLHEIDSHHVYRKPVRQLAPLILGPEGTSVRLGLQRGNHQHLIYVDVVRGWKQFSNPENADRGTTWSHPLPQGAKFTHLGVQ